MENIDKITNQTISTLNDMLNQLSILENEKQKILNDYNNANSSEKIILEAKMKKSESKYKKLYKDITKLSEKIKKLKNKYC